MTFQQAFDLLKYHDPQTLKAVADNIVGGSKMTNYKPVKHYLFMVGAPSDDHDGLLSSKAENPDDAVSADEDDEANDANLPQYL